MDRTFLAVAVAVALATSMVAQAEVVIYGVAHVSVDRLDNDGAGLDAQGDPVAAQDDTFVSSNESRIGFKGEEGLGGDLTAIWQIETEIRLDEGGDDDDGTDLANRNSFVGLRGGWGTLLAGRHDTPVRLLSRAVNLFDEQVGDSNNIVRNKGVTAAGAPASFGFDERPGNAVMYVSPNIAGWQGMALYSTDEENEVAAGQREGDLVSANLTFGCGPLWMGAGYEAHDKALTDGGEEESGWRLALSYELGRLRLTGLYQQLRDLGGVSGADRAAWGIGGALSFGASVLKAQWYGADQLDTVSDSGADLWAVGIDHNFTRNTTGYIAYARTDNEASANFSMATAGRGDTVIPALGGDPSGFSLGLIHRF